MLLVAIVNNIPKAVGGVKIFRSVTKIKEMELNYLTFFTFELKDKGN